jgi:hypothetical protein
MAQIKNSEFDGMKRQSIAMGFFYDRCQKSDHDDGILLKDILEELILDDVFQEIINDVKVGILKIGSAHIHDVARDAYRGFQKKCRDEMLGDGVSKFRKRQIIRMCEI